MPGIHSSFITLLKMLSVEVWLGLFNLVGEVMLGRRLVEYIYDVKKVRNIFIRVTF